MRRRTDLFALEDSVAEAVARSLLLKLTPEQERKMARRYTEDIVAYTFYLKGRYFLEIAELKKARECFEHAIQRDPEYALAYVGLADFHILSFYDVPADLRKSRGLELVSRALRMDETLAEAHVSLAMIKIFNDWDWPGAETELQRAIAAQPEPALGPSDLRPLLAGDRKAGQGRSRNEKSPRAASTLSGGPFYGWVEFLFWPDSTTRPSNSSKCLWISTRQLQPIIYE